MPDTLDTVSCSQAEKSKQYCRSESTVGSVSGMTSQAATAPTAPPPFSHEEFSTLSEMPSVHGVDGIGGRGSAYTITPPTLSSHKLPSISHVDGYSASHSSCPPHGAVSVCGRRRNMEDFVHIAPDFVPVTKNPGGALHFFGVFDGHGGHQVCIFVHVARDCMLASNCSLLVNSFNISRFVVSALPSLRLSSHSQALLVLFDRSLATAPNIFTIYSPQNVSEPSKTTRKQEESGSLLFSKQWQQRF